MKFVNSSQSPKKPLFSRGLYRAIKELDRNVLGKKRRQLELKAQKILKQKEHLIKKIRTVETQERAYVVERKSYDALVRTVTRKLSYEETAPLSERQKELEAFSLAASSEPSQDGLEM